MNSGPVLVMFEFEVSDAPLWQREMQLDSVLEGTHYWLDQDDDEPSLVGVGVRVPDGTAARREAAALLTRSKGCQSTIGGRLLGMASYAPNDS